MKIYRTYSSNETKRLGEEFARKLAVSKRGIATVIALRGDLGAGKTTFTQGLLAGLGVTRRVPSPTFVLMRRYKVKHPHFKNAHHMDAYRLKKAADVSPIGLRELLMDPGNIVLVEWPENIKGALPRQTKMITFKYGKKENERTVQL